MTVEIMTTIEFSALWKRMGFLARYDVTHSFVITVVKRVKEDKKTPYLCGYIGVDFDEYQILKPLDIPEMSFLAIPSDEIMVPWTLINKLLLPIPTHYAGTYADKPGLSTSEFLFVMRDFADKLFDICKVAKNANTTKA